MSWIHVWSLYSAPGNRFRDCCDVVIKTFWYNWKSKPLASSMSPLPVLLHIGSGQHPPPTPQTKAANERFAIHAFDGPVVASKGSEEGLGG